MGNLNLNQTPSGGAHLTSKRAEAHCNIPWSFRLYRKCRSQQQKLVPRSQSTAWSHPVSSSAHNQGVPRKSFFLRVYRHLITQFLPMSTPLKMWLHGLDGLLKDYSCFLRRGVYRGFFTASPLLVEVLPPPTIDQSSHETWGQCRLQAEGFAIRIP